MVVLDMELEVLALLWRDMAPLEQAVIVVIMTQNLEQFYWNFPEGFLIQFSLELF